MIFSQFVSYEPFHSFRNDRNPFIESFLSVIRAVKEGTTLKKDIH